MGTSTPVIYEWYDALHAGSRAFEAAVEKLFVERLAQRIRVLLTHDPDDAYLDATFCFRIYPFSRQPIGGIVADLPTVGLDDFDGDRGGLRPRRGTP